MKISEFCTRLETLLAAKQPGDERYDLAAQALRQAFKLQPDEVAVLTIDRENDVLRFVWPKRLQKSGTIPVTSKDSLAARTCRENKTIANNRFAATFHASIFESIKHDPAHPDRPQPIQKILSAPLPGEGGPCGVIQLSRRGAESNQVGADFSADDVAAMDEIVKVFGKYF